MFLVNSDHLSLKSAVDLEESGALFYKLFGKIWLTLKDAFKILPLTLNLDEKFKSFCDACNVVLPKVNLFVELFVVGR